MGRVIIEYVKGERLNQESQCAYLHDVDPQVQPNGQRKRRAKFLCDCGTEFESQVYSVKIADTRSCGCKHADSVVTHGLSKHPAYHVWHGMIARCHREHAPNYYLYGARGIKVCERWRSIENFIEDMGDRPEGSCLDRVDNDGNYEPSNCRWVTVKENSINKRNSKVWHVHGTAYNSLSQAAKALGVSIPVIQYWCDGLTKNGKTYQPKEGCYSEKVYPNSD